MSALGDRPMFSLVVPVYNVAAFLPDFLPSLSAQTGAPSVEVIFVDDGSTDDSAAIIQTWLTGTDLPATLVRQDNHGLCGARNTGLEHATGAWVSFPDPDDMLTPGYLATVRDFVVDVPDQPDLLCSHALIHDDATGTTTDSHPLRRKFRRGNRVVNMAHFPEHIHLQAASAFYRRDRIEQLELRFDEAIRPNFEDASFTVLYLCAADEPRLGVVADAHYLYRRRFDGSSLVQQSWAQETKYTTVPEHGYLNLLREVQERRGSVPVWAQNTVLYDLMSYFRREENPRALPLTLPGSWTDGFHELVRQILEHVAPETIQTFAVIPTSYQLRAALVAGYQRSDLRPDRLPLVALDTGQRVVQVRYVFGGELPAEVFLVRDAEVAPTFAKVRDLRYLNRVLARERIVWLPAVGTLRILLDGRPMPLQYGAPGPPMLGVRPAALRRHLTETVAPPAPPEGPDAAVGVGATLRATVRAVGARLTRARPGERGDDDHNYHRGWVFLDGDREAGGNAEHLYRFVRRHRPKVNAWFVLHPDSADWDRLAADGFRLVAHGSSDHLELLRASDHLVSSRIDRATVRPFTEAELRPARARFTFLQHDLPAEVRSRWLNRTPVDRLIVASPSDFDELTADHSSSPLTAREVRLTGFPRHDRLLDLARTVPRRDLVLLDPAGAPSESWTEMATSAVLRAVTERADLHLAVLGEDDTDPQRLLARAAVVVTGRPWPAVDAAYLGRPVVDPCAGDLDDVVRAVQDAASAGDIGSSSLPEVFPYRDGRCCERTYRSIVDLTRPPRRTGQQLGSASTPASLR